MLTADSSADTTIAIIGAGPGGLVAARWLVRHGFSPAVFEAADAVGGQWNAANPASATWAGMRTNTSRLMSVFGDLAHDPSVALYPTRDEMGAYLARYAATFDLAWRIRFRTRVERLERRAGGGLTIRSASAAGVQTEDFAHVIVATGPHTVPSFQPDRPGASRPGAAGALDRLHACRPRAATLAVGDGGWRCARTGTPPARADPDQQRDINSACPQGRGQPGLARWPDLAAALLAGSLSPVSFRREGPDALPDAPQRVATAAAAFGVVPAPCTAGAAERALIRAAA